MTTPTPGLDQIVSSFRGAPGAAAGASVELVLGKLASHLDGAEERRRKLWQAIHTVPIRAGALVGLSNASGVLDTPDRFGPHEGYWWDVARLSAWGWTAGTVTVYLNEGALGLGEQLATFPTPGQWTWSSKQLSLAPRDRLVIVAVGVTGNVYVAGQATEVAAPFWADYVGWSVGF